VLDEHGYATDLEDRFMYRITKEQEYVTFNTADETLCEVSLVHLWFEDPELRELYYAVNLDVDSFVRIEVSPEGISQCRECGGDFEQAPGPNYGRKTYCSKACKARASYRKDKERLEAYRAQRDAVAA
jgi:ferredoxin